MGFVRTTLDPFLFCVHHLDFYPEGNAKMGPNQPLIGRHIGSDFDEDNAWKMYHGRTVPGFPAHPHRGFETVTIVLDGLVDHFDSGGATGRYGFGDVQWMTAGSGLMHSEMFPLVNTDRPNRLDLFQIWLNLPAKDKMITPGYEMIWANQVPCIAVEGGQVRIISGNWDETYAPSAPAASWANNPSHEVGIFVVEILPNESLSLPVASAQVNRMLYHIDGGEGLVDGHKLKAKYGMELDPEQNAKIEADGTGLRVLILQGKPIGEPVVQHGPFVMNSIEEIYQAFADFQQTEFGGWQWGSSDVVHPREKGRFAQMADGSIQEPNLS